MTRHILCISNAFGSLQAPHWGGRTIIKTFFATGNIISKKYTLLAWLWKLPQRITAVLQISKQRVTLTQVCGAFGKASECISGRGKSAECYQHQQLNPDARVSANNPGRGWWWKRTRQNEAKSNDLIYSSHSCSTNLLSIHRRHLGWKINTVLLVHNGTDNTAGAKAGSSWTLLWKFLSALWEM